MPEPDNSNGGTGKPEKAAVPGHPEGGPGEPDKAATKGKWPVAEGRYTVGSHDSPVAVCTMASVDMVFPMDRIAIAGKCVTENLGIEKIIRNTVTNPNIRYIIFCGKESHGHFVGQAVRSLKDSGVNGENRIMGARGGMPVLKNISPEEIERFREQIEPVDMAGETDVAKIMAKVNELYDRNPGPFRGENMETGEDIMEHSAEAHPASEWMQDPAGFFTVHPDSGKGEILAEHHDNDGRIRGRIRGTSAENLCHHIIKLGLVSRHDHAAYLGRELAKAEAAMNNGMDYEQDAPLKIGKPIKEEGDETIGESPREPEKKPEISIEERISRLLQAQPVRREPETRPETRGTGRFLTYFKGHREIRLEDSTNPDQEFSNLLREKGLSRLF
jgi:tetrahydromethanopterin S-methyltransferase subunit A